MPKKSKLTQQLTPEQRADQIKNHKWYLACLPKDHTADLHRLLLRSLIKELEESANK